MKKKVYIWIKNDGSWVKYDEFPGDVMIECLKKGEFIEVEEDRYRKIRNDMRRNFGSSFNMLFALFITGRTLLLCYYYRYLDFVEALEKMLEEVHKFEKRYGVKVIFIPGEGWSAKMDKYWYGYFKLTESDRKKLREKLIGNNKNIKRR